MSIRYTSWIELALLQFAFIASIAAEAVGEFTSGSKQSFEKSTSRGVPVIQEKVCSSKEGYLSTY
jgi:hypothetical protein